MERESGISGIHEKTVTVMQDGPGSHRDRTWPGGRE